MSVRVESEALTREWSTDHPATGGIIKTAMWVLSQGRCSECGEELDSAGVCDGCVIAATEDEGVWVLSTVQAPVGSWPLTYAAGVYHELQGLWA